MSDRDHPPVELILAHEDLDGDERRRVDAHLTTCPQCRELLARLQRVEAQARGVAGLPDTADPLADRSPVERAAAARSQRELLQRVTRRTGRRPGRVLPAGLGVIALAAAVTLVMIGPWGSGDPAPDPVLRDLRIGPAVVSRDDAGGTVVAGEPLSIRFTPTRSGWPVVVRLDATGAAVLCPTAAVPGWYLRADRPAAIPPPGSGVVWPAGQPGSRTRWLVALAEAPVDDPAELARGVASSADVKLWLESRFGTVEMLTVAPDASR
jgi:hypothetical protein